MSRLKTRLFIIQWRKNWLDFKSLIRTCKGKVKDLILGPRHQVELVIPFLGTHYLSGIYYQFEQVSSYTERTGRFKFRKVLYLDHLRCITPNDNIISFLTTARTNPADAFADLVYQTARFRKSYDSLESILSNIEKGNKE